MNKSNLKSYAPQARKDFIAAVTARAWPAKVSGQLDQLIVRIRQDGFAHTMEAVAYTWFNRFAALQIKLCNGCLRFKESEPNSFSWCCMRGKNVCTF
jgi:hypothetical protein